MEQQQQLMLMRQQQQHSGVGAYDGVGGGRVTGAPTTMAVGAREATTGPVIIGRGISGIAAAAAGIGMATGPVIMGRGISATKQRPPPPPTAAAGLSTSSRTNTHTNTIQRGKNNTARTST